MRSLKITNTITRRDEKSLDKYFMDIARYEVLTPAEETELFKRYKSGDKTVLTKLVNHNLRFVVSVAKQYHFQNNGLWLGDLINEGNIGLCKAATRFDVTQGFKFISYAVWWIRQSIFQAISEKAKKIRIPQNIKTNLNKIRGEMERALQIKEREATMEELADATNLSVSAVQRCLDNYKMCTSLDAPLNGESDLSMGNMMKDKNISTPDYKLAVEESQQKQIRQLIKILPERYGIIIKLYFGIDRNHPMNLQDISDMLGVSRERIRQIKAKSITIMWTYARKSQLIPTFSN